MKTFVLVLLWVTATPSISGFARQQDPGYKRKLSPPLKSSTALLKKDSFVVFWIVTRQPDSIKNVLQQHHVPFTLEGEYPGAGILVIKTNRWVIDSLLLPSPAVQFIDLPRKPGVERALGAYDISLNTLHTVHKKLPGLNGRNLVVSIKEEKPDSTDIDLAGRYLSSPLSSSSSSGHATIMATIIAGAGNSFYTGLGAAPGALTSSSDFSTLLPDADTDYQQFSISVQNHSYGTGIENYYGADAAAYDASVVNNPHLLHVFSAGNAGDKTSTEGVYAGISNMANLTGSFKMAKNILTVGAVDSFNRVALLSSKGPAYDGRVKPELVAFGEDGSSGAAAMVSGATLLLQQAYKELHNDSLPSAALVKAVLINNANDIDLPGPDYVSGFGSLNTYKAVETILQNRYETGSVAQNELQSFPLTIPANTRRIKITLCWTDPPATPGDNKALINDLDLEVENNTSHEKWLPWVLSTAANKDSLLLPATRNRDSLNNAEQVSIENPAAGNYSIHVKGYSLAGDPQLYSIAYQLDTAEQFTWNFPVANDHFLANANNITRWASTYATTTGILEYSLNKGNDWQLLDDAVNLSKNFYSWQVPDTFCTVLLRMTINGQVYETDTCSISVPPVVKVGFHCTDSVLLYWNKQVNATSYTMYRLGKKYLEPITSTSDTQLVVNNPQLNSSWYTVEPVLPDYNTGLRAYTFDYSLQGVACYIKNFLADLFNTNTANLQIELGTNYNVKSIRVEKLGADSITTIQLLNPVTDLQYLFTDTRLTRGVNTYRLKIELQDGSILYSQPESVYYFQQSKYLVFPNPARSNGFLNILAEDPFNNHLKIYNAHGHLVLDQLLNNTASVISLQRLPKGIYFVILLKNGVKEYEGKLVVLE